MSAAPSPVPPPAPGEILTRREPQPRAPTSVNLEARTAEIIISTGAAVRRWYGTEIIDVSGVDTSRISTAGIPLVDSHDTSTLRNRFGQLISARIERGQLVGTVRFDRTEAGDRGLALAQEGCAVSIGYRITEHTDSIDPDSGDTTRNATGIECLEVSFVMIPADPGAQVRGYTMDDTDSVTGTTPATPRAAPAIQAAANAERMAAFSNVERAFQLPDGEGARMARHFRDAEAWRAFMLDERAERDRQTHTSSINCGLSPQSVRSAAAIEAIAHRMDPSIELSPLAREMRGLSLLDFARDDLTARGVRGVRAMSREAIFEMACRSWTGGAHTTSDFPNLLTAATNRVLLQAFEDAQSPLMARARRSTRRDFRPVYNLRFGEIPPLQQFNADGGEIKGTTIGEGAESYSMYSYGGFINWTLKAMINDDLGAVQQTPREFGRAVAETQTAILLALLTGAPTMSDGKALFHADHGNLAASGGAIGESTLSAARLAMRTQKGIDGSRLTPATPRTLLVGPAKETEAEKQLAALNAAQSSNVNPFAGRLELAVEPRLSGNSWFVFADPGQMPCIEYAYLDDAQGPQIAMQDGWNPPGVSFRVVLHFGAGAVDWRGAYKNPGA